MFNFAVHDKIGKLNAGQFVNEAHRVSNPKASTIASMALVPLF